MLACLDAIDDHFISDANVVPRTLAVIQTSGRRDHNIFLYFTLRLYVNRKSIVRRCTKDLFTFLRVNP